MNKPNKDTEEGKREKGYSDRRIALITPIAQFLRYSKTFHFHF